MGRGAPGRIAHLCRRMPEKVPTMDLKTVVVDGVTYAVVQDGKPVYVEGGKEVAFDAVGTRQTITRLNGEAQSHRERAEKAEGQLKGFEGIKDPAAAIKALETVANLDQKKLIDAGEVERVKTEAIRAVEERFKPIVEERDRLQSDLYGEKVGGSFARSKFIAEKLAIPADFAQARFEKHFKVEGGKTVGYDSNGNLIYSRARPGEPADFEESLEFLVEAYPQKDLILKGEIKSGGGAGQPHQQAGSKVIKQAQFDALPPKERAAKMAEGYQLVP